VSEGTKLDTGKPRWDLLPIDEAEDVVRVLTFGAVKYEAYNWQLVKGARWRYLAAGFRHLAEWMRGNRLDAETGLPHLAHAACNLLFLAWFDRHPEAGLVDGAPAAELLERDNRMP
jgi:hypothetical protein